MAINLFSHNLEAYNAAVEMLHQTGKAAIIHPTGTGKSYIAFRLIELHPKKKLSGFHLRSTFLEQKRSLLCGLTLTFLWKMCSFSPIPR